MHYVVVTVLEDLTVDALVGPFESAGEAMTWADLDSQARQRENPEFQRESSDDMMILSDMSDAAVDEPAGFIYQVIQPTPAVIVKEAPDET